MYLRSIRSLRNSIYEKVLDIEISYIMMMSSFYNFDCKYYVLWNGTKEEKEKELERCYKIIEEQEAEFSMDVLEAYRKYNQSINRYYYIKNKILESLRISKLKVIKNGKLCIINKGNEDFFNILKETYNGKYKIVKDFIEYEPYIEFITKIKPVFIIDRDSYEKVSGPYKLTITGKNSNIRLFDCDTNKVVIDNVYLDLPEILPAKSQEELSKILSEKIIELEKINLHNNMIHQQIEVTKMIDKV